MSKQFAKLKVYEIGGGVAFQTETGAVPFLVIPKGQATMKPWGASGFVFENVVTGDVIAYVDTFDDLLDSAGVAWGISQAAVFTAVGAFFFELGGGGDAIDINYDNSVSGLAATNVQDAIDELEAGYFKYYTGNTQNFLETSGVVSIVGGVSVWSANNLFAYPVHIKEDVTIIDIRVGITSSVAGNSVWGLYDMANGLPNNKIFQSTPYDNAVTGTITYTLPAPITIKKGLYFVVYNTSSTPNLVARDAFNVINVFGASNAIVFASAVIILAAGYVYTGTLPATFGSPVTPVQTAYVPNVLFTIS